MFRTIKQKKKPKKMSMPPELSRLIQDFARPNLTHPQWRLGGSFSSYLFYDGLNDLQYSGPLPSALTIRLGEAEHEWLISIGSTVLSAEAFDALNAFDMF